MQPLVALLLAAAAACAVARPPGPSPAPASLQEPGPVRVPSQLPGIRLGDYLPRFRVLLPHYLGYEESPRIPPPISEHNWLNKEIDRINQMEDEENVINPYEMELARMISQDIYVQGMLDSPMSDQDAMYAPEPIGSNLEDYKSMPIMTDPLSLQSIPSKEIPQKPMFHLKPYFKENLAEPKSKFAFTPAEKEFYEGDDTRTDNNDMMINHGAAVIMHHEGGDPKMLLEIEPPRQTRQNPNLSKQKHLLEPDLGKLKTGLSHDDGVTPKQHHVHMLESAADPADSIYGIALVAAVGAALTMAVVGFAFGWYTLSRKAKAAADVDYPAYGVTGPTMDTSGDRKLAQSAHMYHYQHQKQQIIAMERNGLEQRAGSVSDPESEEENEEGDYTVYECPGFATTGDIEVKNPLFSEDPTPATPGKCEVVKPQPKD